MTKWLKDKHSFIEYSIGRQIDVMRGFVERDRHQIKWLRSRTVGIEVPERGPLTRAEVRDALGRLKHNKSMLRAMVNLAKEAGYGY